MEDVAPTKFTRDEDSVGETADCAMATGEWGDEAMLGYMGEDLGGSVGRTCTEASYVHRGKVVDVVAEEAGVFEGNAELGGEVTNRCGLVADTLGYKGDVELLCVTVDQRGVFTGDEGHLYAEAAEQRDAHDVREGEAFRLFPGGRPGEGAIGEDAIYIEGDGLQGDELLGVKRHCV